MENLQLPDCVTLARADGLATVTLDRGSWQLTVSAPGHMPVRYPVHIERMGHWNPTEPSSGAPAPVRLPTGPPAAQAPAAANPAAPAVPGPPAGAAPAGQPQ